MKLFIIYYLIVLTIGSSNQLAQQQFPQIGLPFINSGNNISGFNNVESINNNLNLIKYLQMLGSYNNLNNNYLNNGLENLVLPNISNANSNQNQMLLNSLGLNNLNNENVKYS
jgi:hypothetical protein